VDKNLRDRINVEKEKLKELRKEKKDYNDKIDKEIISVKKVILSYQSYLLK
jgi:hypothetical protein